MKITIKIWILIVAVLLSLISIFGIPPKVLEKGIEVDSLNQDSKIFEEGLREGMVIRSINGKTIETLEDYASSFDILRNLRVALNKDKNRPRFARWGKGIRQSRKTLDRKRARRSNFCIRTKVKCIWSFRC